ncbi:MAG: chorismate synthase [Candidatus Mcinerneyibacterium aminivorans]|uniref:Chorismate synthase n=1 Tax=Candidatus Mcinerneyibacterium aminivorans TaxID=2703815 RepID=A0A5D0MGN6_9BACT|nr:MAG: chorismate synthase [Candidatus Mcinerneyibacterium aminivorans]
MNTFGNNFRVEIFGESHGEIVGILIDGVPPGIRMNEDDFSNDLKRRNPRREGITDRKEKDIPQIKTGIFNDKTTGAPVLIYFKNEDADSSKYEDLKNKPRPGHADFTAYKKYRGYNDYRGGGIFSGRLTTGLVAAGVLAKKIIQGINIKAEVISVGGLDYNKKNIDKLLEKDDSFGGIIECRATNTPVGLGEPFFDSAESVLSHILFSIPGIKGVEFGAGFDSAKMKGSEFNDEIIDEAGKTATNNAGGINGGITNGNDLIFRIAVRPASSISKKQNTINLKTGKNEEIKIEGRHDKLVVLRMPVIIEAVTAITLADLKITSKMHD